MSWRIKHFFTPWSRYLESSRNYPQTPERSSLVCKIKDKKSQFCSECRSPPCLLGCIEGRSSDCRSAGLGGETSSNLTARLESTVCRHSALMIHWGIVTHVCARACAVRTPGSRVKSSITLQWKISKVVSNPFCKQLCPTHYSACREISISLQQWRDTANLWTCMRL